MTVPDVERVDHVVEGRTVSGLKWGDGPPRAVFLHGGGQNAHTWDKVLLSLGLPALAIDLPGHGRSDWRDDVDYRAQTNADTVRSYLTASGVSSTTVVGMSLGGLTALNLAARAPELVTRLMLVDVTPSTGRRFAAMAPAERGGIALLADTATYPDFESLLDSVTTTLPDRSRDSLRRGVFHNAVEGDDGRWRWRADRRRTSSGVPVDHMHDWDVVGQVRTPITLVIASGSGGVPDEDVQEFRRRAPHLRTEVIDTDNHSVQSSSPVELAGLVRQLLEH